MERHYQTKLGYQLPVLDEARLRNDQKRLTEGGAEILDGTPIAPPVGYFKQPSMVEHIRNMVRGELLRHAAQNQGFETFEEAEDFDVDDDPDPHTPYEAIFEPAVDQVGGAGGSPPAAAPEAEPLPAEPSPA